MLKEMPCGKETVTYFDDPVQGMQRLLHGLKTTTWFGFAEVDIEVHAESFRAKVGGNASALSQQRYPT